MLRSDKEVLTSFPITVRFAGFESNTFALQNAGWDLSLQQQYHNATCRLALQLEKAGIFAMTSEMDFMAMELLYRLQKGNTECLRALAFDIIYIGSGMQFQRIPVATYGNSFLGSFNPIDATPQEMVIEKPEDFSLFKRIDKSKDIFVDPNDVPGLMEMILKAQRPEQDLIKMRQKSRDNLEKWRGSNEYRSNLAMDFKSPIDIKAQILTVAS